MTKPQPLEGDYDYIIVGAGTAGCVLANRLSADPKCRVLLLEAGGSDNYHWVHIPVGYLYCIGNPRTDWMMTTAAEPGLNGRRLAYPRGKLLGGCSSVNGMIYMRGHAADYDRWRQLGNPGWGWDDVLPYFIKSQDHHAGASALHGAGGEWKVSRQKLEWEILQAVQDGAKEFGIEPRADFNDGSNEGSGFFEVNQRNGVRWNTAKGFLRPAMRRPNLRVMTHAETERVLIEGRQVTGVRFRHKGRVHEACAKAEVLLAAGAINSPKLMELSGIGDPRLLGELGIDVRHAQPGVGANLQDHLQIRTVFRVSNTVTLNEVANSLRGKLRIAAEYALRRSGPMSMAPSQFGMFTRSDPSLDMPDLEYHVQPLSTDKLGDPLHRFPAITVSVCNLRPESVGSSHIASAETDRQPDIRLNYLSADADRRIALASIRQARQIMTARALAPYAPQEILPGPAVVGDPDLLEAAGNIATTIFHPVGTCRMGSDPAAVVDPKLRVRGVNGLRVVDASIMPRIVSGNTASPVVMIAEKAADMIQQS
ncbi:GMC family oxidoreductase N-terminal domain-containing protein [Salipiger pacificus]|nr:GMC family oxidoreductase N-terminal domain-containing protein [Alloyangia pacifica]MCA0946998.1 GMC family oxidoreductase N-terminal domain-containing protein [Alloyangia pacifica]